MSMWLNAIDFDFFTPLDIIKLLYEDCKNDVLITAIPQRDSVTRTNCLFVARGRDTPYSVGLGASYRSVYSRRNLWLLLI